MAANNGEDSGQPQPRAQTLLFSRKERVEDVFNDLAGNADTGVGYGDTNILFRRRAWRQSPLFLVQITVSSFNHELPPGGHRVAGVDAKVHQHLAHLRSVADDAPQVIRRLNLKIDVFRQSSLEYLRDISDQVDCLERGAFAFGSAGESQDAFDQVFALLGAPTYEREASPLVREFLLQRLEGHQDRRQDVVEVVRHRAGQRPDAFHPLRAQNHRFEAFRFGAVLAEAALNRDEMCDYTAVVMDRGYLQFDGALGAVLAVIDHLAGETLPRRHAILKSPENFLVGLRAIQGARRTAHQLLRPVASHPRKGRTDKDYLRAGSVELRRCDEDRIEAFHSLEIEQPAIKRSLAFGQQGPWRIAIDQTHCRV